MVIRGMKNSVNLFNKETQRKNIRKWVLTHKYTPSVGRIVLAAPGSGKSKYIETNSDWIDADFALQGSARDLGIHNLKWHDNNYGPNTPCTSLKCEKQHYTLCDLRASFAQPCCAAGNYERRRFTSIGGIVLGV